MGKSGLGATSRGSSGSGQFSTSPKYSFHLFSSSSIDFNSFPQVSLFITGLSMFTLLFEDVAKRFQVPLPSCCFYSGSQIVCMIPFIPSAELFYSLTGLPVLCTCIFPLYSCPGSIQFSLPSSSVLYFLPFSLLSSFLAQHFHGRFLIYVLYHSPLLFQPLFPCLFSKLNFLLAFILYE